MIEEICKHCKHCLSCLCGDEFKSCKLKKSPSERAFDFGVMLRNNGESEDSYTSGAAGYEMGATEQKKIDEVQMRKLEEALKAYRAFCYNIINGMYIDNEKAAVEQLEYINTDFFNEEGFELLEDTK